MNRFLITWQETGLSRHYIRTKNMTSKSLKTVHQ